MQQGVIPLKRKKEKKKNHSKPLTAWNQLKAKTLSLDQYCTLLWEKYIGKKSTKNRMPSHGKAGL